MPFQTVTAAPQGHPGAPAGTTGAVVADERADQARADQARPVWVQPLSVPQLALLMITTMGLYALFWTGGLIADVRRHLNPKVRVWRYVLGLIVPITSPFVFYRITGHVAGLMRQQGVSLGPPRWFLTALFCLVFVVAFSTGPFGPEALSLGDAPMASLALIPTLYTIPWLLLQRQLNAVKRSVAEADWTAKPFSFTGRQVAAMVVFVGLWSLSIAAPYLEDLTFEEGKALYANIPVIGPSGDYTLIPVSDAWRLVEAADHNPEADLVLFGPGLDTWVVVFVTNGGGHSFEDHVDGRRGEIAAIHDSLKIEEHRELLPQGELPISYAFYQGQTDFPRDTNAYWSAIFVTDSVAVEALGRAQSGSDAVNEMERVVKSLRPSDSTGNITAANTQ